MKMLIFLFLSLLYVGLSGQITVTENASVSCCSKLEMKVRELDRKVDSCTLKAKIAKLEECIEIIENKDKAPDTSTLAPVEKSNVTSGQRLRNLEVSIGMSLSSMQVCGYYKGPGSNGEMIPISCREPIEARYVKVMIKDENTLDTILNFAEIQVFS